MTIPLALIMGVWMYKLRPGKGIREATVFGVIGLIAAVVFGKWIPVSVLAPYFTFSRHGLTILLGIYAVATAILSVWLLLAPCDYLSTFMKISTILFLILGAFIVLPDFTMPSVAPIIAAI